MNSKAAFTAALWATGLFGAGLLAPLLGQAVAVFAPVPVMVAYVKHGRREGLAAAALAFLAAALMGGWEGGAVFLVAVGLVALGTAEGMRRGLPPERAVLLGGLPPLFLTVAVLGLVVLRVGVDPIAFLETQLREVIQQVVKLYTTLGLNEEARAVQSISDPFIFYSVRLMPSLVLVSVLVQVACCYGATRIILARRAGPSAAPGLPLAAWHAPDVWVWGLIAALGFAALPVGAVRLAGWNLAVVYSVVYAAQGIAIIEFWFKKALIPPVARAVLIVFILMPPVVFLVIALGVVDVWADLRRVREKPAAGKE